MKLHYYPSILTLILGCLITITVLCGASNLYEENPSELIFLLFCNLTTLNQFLQLFITSFLTYMSVKNHTPYRLREDKKDFLLAFTSTESLVAIEQNIEN